MILHNTRTFPAFRHDKLIAAFGHQLFHNRFRSVYAVGFARAFMTGRNVNLFKYRKRN